MPKKTKSDLCKQFGITPYQLDYAKNKGVNIWSESDLAAHLAKKRPKMPSMAKTQDEPTRDDIAFVDPQTLEMIETEIRKSTDYNHIRMLKEKLASLIMAQKLRIELAESFTADEVKERDSSIGAAMRSAMMRIESELPAQCEGLNASQLKALFRDFCRSILTDLADGQSAFWDDVDKRKMQ
jgi:hypothetical protein